MTEQAPFPGFDKDWNVWHMLETIVVGERQQLRRGVFTYTVKRIDDSTVELHTHRALEHVSDDGGVGIRGFVLVRYDLENLLFLALPFVIIPPGDGSEASEDSGTPVVVSTEFSDIEGPLDALEAVLMDDDYVDGIDPLDWRLGETSHGPALGFVW